MDLLCSLPCDRIKGVIAGASSRSFLHLPLTREEEGVGICAGAALAGKRPAMLIQNSGVGNMVNALLSLTLFYELPLAIFLSHRGVYKEDIPAQIPMGEAVPALLEAMGIGYSHVSGQDELDKIEKQLNDVYSGNKVHAFLLSPAIWESSCSEPDREGPPPLCFSEMERAESSGADHTKPEMIRYEILKCIKQYIEGQVVICNLGIPSKELYHILDQPSNFYMLGSMGMATPIGLGLSLFTHLVVYVIDGDGSLLMNPGTLASVASAAPDNLKVIAIDNGAYGSTGSQPTLTGKCVDLEEVARGFGMGNTLKAGSLEQYAYAMDSVLEGPVFMHFLARSGNADVGNIPMDRIEIKERFMRFLVSPEKG